MRHKLFLKSDAARVEVYDDAFAMYSLRNVFNWQGGVLELRRLSDNQLKWVHFENETITLNSGISDFQDDVPSDTLGNWIGSNDAFVRSWAKIRFSGVFVNNDKLVQGTNSRQPQFINNGVINTKNGKPTIIFDGVDDYMSKITGFYSQLNSGNAFTVINISYNDVSLNYGIVYSTQLSSSNRYLSGVDRRTSVSRISVVGVTTTSELITTDLIIPDNTNNQRLISDTMNNKTLSSYYNSVFQSQDTYTGDYLNSSFIVGTDNQGANNIQGGIQEIIMYPSDKTADLDAIHTDINNYYNIY